MADPNEILFRTQKNEADAVQALIDGGVDPSYANGVGQTALHVACLWGNIDVAKVLVKAGAKVNAVNGFSGAAPLHCAATENDRGNKEGRKECIKLLMTAGADPNLRDMRGETPTPRRILFRVWRCSVSASQWRPLPEGPCSLRRAIAQARSRSSTLSQGAAFVRCSAHPRSRGLTRRRRWKRRRRLSSSTTPKRRR
jgi:hypothetical protein